MKNDTRFLLGMVYLALAFVASMGLLTACQPTPAETAQATPAVELHAAADQAADAVSDAATTAQSSMATAVVPALVAAQEELASVLPAPPLEASLPTWAVSPAAVDMIVRFEIISPAYYTKALQRPIWPGGASGVTWGIGYDGGHQTRQRIASDWVAHPSVGELSTTSGIMGEQARAALPRYRHIVTPLALAQDVFAQATLPTYTALAARTFRDGWECLTPDERGSLAATAMNRGTAMRGDRRREMRVLRDECVPNCDGACMAAQYRSMKRVWVGTVHEVGLARRYEATARLVEGADA